MDEDDFENAWEDFHKEFHAGKYPCEATAIEPDGSGLVRTSVAKSLFRAGWMAREVRVLMDQPMEHP